MNDYILEKGKDLLISILIDRAEDIRCFLISEACKTDNQLDDALVDIVCDWGLKFLKEQKRCWIISDEKSSLKEKTVTHIFCSIWLIWTFAVNDTRHVCGTWLLGNTVRDGGLTWTLKQVSLYLITFLYKDKENEKRRL